MDNNSEINKAIYDQDCEFYRYQDGLMWSRFQTASLIEGAVLAGLYQTGLGQFEQRGLMIFGFLLVLVVCLLSLKDQNDAYSHLDRVMKFEKLGASFASRRWPRFLSGRMLMLAGIVLINIFNTVILINKW